MVSCIRACSGCYLGVTDRLSISASHICRWLSSWYNGHSVGQDFFLSSGGAILNKRLTELQHDQEDFDIQEAR
jgi:hypothetical protein